MNRVAPVFAAPRRARLVRLTVNGILQGLLAALGAGLAGRAFGPDGYSTAALLGGFAAIAVAISALRIGELIDAERLGQQYAIETRMNIFRHLFVADPEATDKLSRGVLMLRFVTDLNGLRLWASMGVARLLAGLATLIAALGMLAWHTPHLAGAAGIALALSLLLLAGISPRLRTAERALRRQRGRLASNAHARLTDIDSLRLDENAASRAARKMLKRSEEVAAAAITRARIRGGARAIGDLGAWAALAGVIWVAREAPNLPDVIGAVTLAGLLAAPLASIVRAVEYHHGYVVAREKINRVLTLPTKGAPSTSVSNGYDDDEE